MAVAEEGFLKAEVGVFDAGDDAIWVNADKGDNSRAPASDLGFEASATGAKLIIREFIRAGGGALDDVGNAEPEIEKKGPLERRKESRGESTAVKRGPETIARAAEMTADGGGVEARVDAREENDEILGREIRNEFVARGKDLGFGGFPGSDQFLRHGGPNEITSGILVVQIPSIGRRIGRS